MTDAMKSDKAVEQWLSVYDTDKDGSVTLAEFLSAVAAKQKK